MRAMQRETLELILSRTHGTERTADRFVTREAHELTVYVGRPGSAMALQNVLSITLADAHVEIEVKERGTFYTAYDAVHALLDGPRKERSGGRSGVGF